ncbi:protein of unknown function [Magnetospira sp. QH-2]|nr:protein of unknown function [Magnetospira sp. QH-2]
MVNNMSFSSFSSAQKAPKIINLDDKTKDAPTPPQPPIKPVKIPLHRLPDGSWKFSNVKRGSRHEAVEGFHQQHDQPALGPGQLHRGHQRTIAHVQGRLSVGT